MFLPATRIASPWIWGLTLGNSSRISLVSFLANVVGQALAQRDHLLDGVSAGRLDLAPVEDLQAQVAPDGLRLDQVLDHLGPELVVGEQDQLGLLLLEVDLGALEVEALLDLASDLVEGVPKLLLVEIADHIERDVTGHARAPSLPLIGDRPPMVPAPVSSGHADHLPRPGRRVHRDPGRQHPVRSVVQPGLLRKLVPVSGQRWN